MPITVAPRCFAHWRRDQPDAARGGVEEDRVAGLHREGPAQEVLRRHALQHHRGGGVVIDPVRQLDHELDVGEPLLGVVAEGDDVGDAVAGLEARDALADLDDLAGRLVAEA